MGKLWLIDVDGTVLDKQRIWEQLERVFHQTFPDLPIKNFRAYYDSHKGQLHSVEAVMAALVDEHGIDPEKFKGMFDQVDYAACFDREGWQRLQEQAKREGFDMAFFTQGTRWVQEAKQRRLEQIVGEFPWHIFEGDKMEALPRLIEGYQQQGIEVEGLVDDVQDNRLRAERHGLRTRERL